MLFPDDKKRVRLTFLSVDTFFIFSIFDEVSQVSVAERFFLNTAFVERERVIERERARGYRQRRRHREQHRQGRLVVLVYTTTIIYILVVVQQLLVLIYILYFHFYRTTVLYRTTYHVLPC